MKILFRHSLAELGEYEIAKKYFNVIDSRSLIKPGDEILCRYSMLPFPTELQTDVKNLGGTLINTLDDHEFVADLVNSYGLLSDITPKTWFSLQEAIAAPYSGPYVLKGKTNSRKYLWKTHMFAETKDDMREVYLRLMEDTLISEQGVCVRKFEQFKNYGLNLAGAPITKEFRVFVYKNQIVAKGFYWANEPEVIDQYRPDANEIPPRFIAEVISRIGNHVNFWVADIAQHEDGRWMVVELNDGCMSGLSTIDPDEFYRNLKQLCS